MRIQNILSLSETPNLSFAHIIVRADNTHAILAVNEAFLELFAPICRRPREQLLGKSFLSIAPDSDLKKLLPLLTVDTKASPIDLAFAYGHDKTDTLWVRFFLEKDFYEGQPAYRLVALDISDLKQAALNAKNANEMKSLFLATISHEIRTPMQPIYGLLELMATQTNDPELLKNIQTAKIAASGLLQILDDVLDLAKAEAGKIELDDFEVPLRTLLEGVTATLNVKALDKGLSLKYSIDPDVPKVIRGDPKRLRQILTNLVSNAIKFTETGSVSLTISAQQPHENANTVTIRFEVQDTGIGLSPESMEKLFQPFTQADASTTRKYGGTGLGLSICQRLVELMNGKIGVWSDLSSGSTFWFEIPTSAVDVSLIGQTDDADGNTRLPDLSNCRILLVEDHPQGSQSIMLSLRTMQAKADSAFSAAKARDAILKETYDIIIIDHALPDDTGIEVMDYAAKHLPNAGLIYHTVYDTDTIREAVKSHGALYLAKPSSRLGLAEAILSLLEHRQSAPANNSTRLLVIEDNLAIRDLLKRQLTLLGVKEVDFAENGLKGLAHLSKHTYGLIISDLHMPEMDGYGFIHAVRDDQKNETPVLALTADVQIMHNKAYNQHGFNGYLLKPISLDQLRRTLQRWCIITSTTTVDTDSRTAINVHEIVDVEAIRRQFGDFDRDSMEMLQSFLTCTEPQIQELHHALQAKDHAEVYELSHSLKGSARMAGCMRLGSIAERLQEKAKEKRSDVSDGSTLLAIFKETQDKVAALAAMFPAG